MNREKELVAVVTGASRGIGRGIALEFGMRGMTVYVVGRTTISGNQVSPSGGAVPGSIYEVANGVTASGGRGIAVACDLADDDAIRALFEQVKRDSGRVDILVNNAAYLDERMAIRPFWEAPATLANIINVGLRCHHIATYYAAPLMIQSGRALIVNISFYSNAKVHDPSYYAAKAGLDKLASVYAEDFAPFNVAAISLWPGFVKTERAALKMGDANEMVDGMGMESPHYCGRVINALWEDTEMMSFSGKTLIAAELGSRYDVSDLSGYNPKSLREFYGSPHPQYDVC